MFKIADITNYNNIGSMDRGGVVIDRVKIWLLSPPNLIPGDILRSLAFSEYFFQ